MVEAKDIIDQTLCFGTVNPETLCDIFLPTCKALGAPVPGLDFDSDTGCENEYWVDLWIEISDALNQVAPEGAYFGGHPDDPANIGFWKEREEGDESQES